MKRVIVGLVFLLAVFGRAGESELRLSPKKIRDEVKLTVETQLAAFRSGDFEAAYALASSRLKQQFEPPIFAAMIRRGYPLLLRSTGAELGVVRDEGGETAEVTVTVLDRQKRRVVYRYVLVHESEGWRINGVTLEQKPVHADA